MEPAQDKIIFLNLKTGDSLAFHALYKKYFQPLYLFALKFVDEDIAKDLVQDCFYDLWQNRQKVEITSSLSAYLFTIIRNRCYKNLKKGQQKLEQDNNFGMRLKQEELQFFVNSEKSIFEFDIKDRIGKVMQQLPEKCAEVFTESRFNGLTNKEIAKKFNISVKAVEKHISRALKIFREEFKDLLTVLLVLLSQFFF